ncbi:Hypothetical predicted protein, partial [Pelobates cultripes]
RQNNVCSHEQPEHPRQSPNVPEASEIRPTFFPHTVTESTANDTAHTEDPVCTTGKMQ